MLRIVPGPDAHRPPLLAEAALALLLGDLDAGGLGDGVRLQDVLLARADGAVAAEGLGLGAEAAVRARRRARRAAARERPRDVPAAGARRRGGRVAAVAAGVPGAAGRGAGAEADAGLLARPPAHDERLLPRRGGGPCAGRGLRAAVGRGAGTRGPTGARGRDSRAAQVEEAAHQRPGTGHRDGDQ